MQLGMVGLGRMGAGMTKRLEQHDVEMKSYDPKVASTAKTLRALAKQLERAAARLADGAVRQDHRGHVPEAARHPRARRHDRRRRQLELPRLAAPLQGGAQAEDRVRRRRRLRRDLGARGRLLPDGRRRQGAGEAARRPCSTALAPENGWAHVGTSGAGHFTKMVHNGIEYGLMQAYAEGFELMHQSEFELDLSEIAGIWRYGSVVRSWLLELLHEALEQHGDGLDDDRPLRRGLRRGPLDDQRGDRRAPCRCPRSAPRSSPASPRGARSTSPPRCRPRCETSSAATPSRP